MDETKNGQEIVVMNNAGLADMSDDIIASAERRIAQLDKIKILAIKCTNASDWIDQNGKPYLAASGAEKIARLFGVSWKIVKNEKLTSNDEKGSFYFYNTIGIFTLAGGRDSIEAVGTCSSKDAFFAKSGGTFKPISEVDETNIMKSAYTNCIANGITRLLGIRNLTWEQVKSGGIDKEKTGKVEYASGGAGGGLISDAQANRLYAIGKSTGKTDAEMKAHLKEKYKIESSKEIKKTDYEAICAWAGKPKE